MMVMNLPKWLKPPSTIGVDEKANVATLLWIVLMCIPIMVILGTIMMSESTRQPPVIYLAALMFLLTYIVCTALLYRGYVYSSAWTFVSVSWLVFSALIVLSGGQHAHGITILMALNLIAAFTTGFRGNLLFTIATVTLISVFSILDIQNLYPNPIIAPLITFNDLVAVLFVSIFLQYVVNLQKRAVQRAEDNRKQLANALNDLQSTSVSNAYVDGIINSMRDMLIVLDENLIIEKVNSATVRILNYAESSLIGQPIAQLFAYDADLHMRELDSLLNRTSPKMPEYDPNAKAMQIKAAYRTRLGGIREVDFTAARLIQDAVGKRIVCVAKDITEQERAIEALRLSEMRLLTILDNTDAILWGLDPGGDITFVQGKGLQTPDIHQQYPVGKNVLDLFADIPTVLQDFQRALDGDRFHATHEFPTFTLENHFTPIYDPDKNFTGVIIFSLNLTERVKIERQLQERHNLLTTLIDTVPVPIYAKDANGRYILSNPRHKTLMGLPIDFDILGKTPYELFPPEVAKSYDDQDREILSTGQSVSENQSYRTSLDGQPRWLAINKSPVIDGDGTITSVIASAMDVTDRVIAEQQIAEERNLLRRLIDSIPDMVYVKGRDGRYMLSNLLHTYEVGEEDSAALIGEDSDRHVPPEMRDVVKAEDEQVLSGISLLNLQREVTLRGNRKRTLSVSKVPLYDAENEVIGIITVMSDVSEMIAAERRLADERNLLRILLDSLPDYVHAKDLKGRYILSNAAHTAHMTHMSAEAGTRIIGKKPSDVMDRDAAIPLELDDQHVLSSGESIYGLELPGLDKSGEPAWFRITKVPLRDATDKIIGVIGIATDITQNKRDEERIRASEERLRAVIENAPVFIFAIDNDYNLTVFEGKGTSMMDIEDVGRVLGQSLFDSGSKMEVAGAVEKAFQGEEVNSIVTVPPLTFDVRYSPIYDEEDNITGITGVATDISDRVQAEERNSALLQALPDMMFVVNRDGILTDYHVHYDLTPAINRSNIVGSHLRQIGFQDDVLETILNIIKFCADDGGMRAIEYDLVNSRGTIESFEARFARLNANEVIIVARDVTENRMAQAEIYRRENMYRTLAGNLPYTAVTLYNPQLRHLIAEGEILEHFGLHAEAIEGYTLDEVLAADELEWLRPAYETGLRQVVQEEIEYDSRHYVLNTLPLYDENNAVYAGMAVLRDVTESRHQTDALRRFARNLERSNRELEEFAYVASHDLQEPLRKIQAFGDRLQSHSGEHLDETALDYLQRMQNAAERMQSLIQDLLTFSRVTTRAQPFQSIDLNDVIDGVLNDLEISIERTEAQVQVAQLPLIEAEAHQMRQLFQNLISNSLKYRKLDVAPIVQIHLQSRDEFQVEITVTDNGIGFDTKYNDRIFGLFQRLHARKAYEGTGMGLAICRKIVERHNGTIQATGMDGEGAIFTITLPIRQQEED